MIEWKYVYFIYTENPKIVRWLKLYIIPNLFFEKFKAKCDKILYLLDYKHSHLFFLKKAILDPTYKGEHKHWSFCGQFISLNVIFSNCNYFNASDKMMFFFNSWIIFHYLYHILFTSWSRWWTLWLTPYFSYCEPCC